MKIDYLISPLNSLFLSVLFRDAPVRSDWVPVGLGTGPTGYPVRLGDRSDWYPVRLGLLYL